MSDPARASSTPYELSAIEADILTPIVRVVLDDGAAELLDWRYERIHGGFGDAGGTVISGLYRFRGQAMIGAAERAWSVVLKVAGASEGGLDPSDTRYWQREVLAYQSGILEDLPGGLAAPHFYGTIQFAQDIVGLWLEDLTDDISETWPLAQYADVARHLGQFNGTYLVGRAMPEGVWVSRGWIHQHVKPNDAVFADLKQRQHESEARLWFLEEDAAGFVRLWADRFLFLEALDGLPQTFVHRDAFRRNLFARQAANGTASTVAVDWAFPGMGAVGEELVCLVCATLAFAEVAIDDVQELESLAFEGYLAGLGDAGWSGDPRLARLGFTAGAAMVWGLGYRVFLLEESWYPALEVTMGKSMSELIPLWARLNRYVLSLAEEARQLIVEM